MQERLTSIKVHGCAPEDLFFNRGTITVRANLYSIFLRNNILRQDYFQMKQSSSGYHSAINDNNSGRYVNTVQQINGR